MAKKDKEEIVVGLDIGTTKVCTVVGEVTDKGVEVIGVGTQPSRGLRKGVVVNIAQTVSSIQQAIDNAELMAGVDIGNVYAGISGGHIGGFNSSGVIKIKNGQVTDGDIHRVVEAARAVPMAGDREVIHIFPQEFIVDGQDGFAEPIGISGVRLEAKVHIVTGAATSSKNLIKSCQSCGLNVADVVLQQIASSEAVLTPEEKELGVAIVDIGGGTTDVAIFLNKAIRYTSVLSTGGNHLTNDISIGLRTPSAEAERIKKKYACGLVKMVSEHENIEVPSVGGRPPRLVSRRYLAEITELRMEEIFNLVNEELTRSELKEFLSAGVVVTGGASMIEGCVELAEEVFDLPVRRGVPRGVTGLVEMVRDPLYATGVGLVLYGSRRGGANGRYVPNGAGTMKKAYRRVARWVQESF